MADHRIRGLEVGKAASIRCAMLEGVHIVPGHPAAADRQGLQLRGATMAMRKTTGQRRVVSCRGCIVKAVDRLTNHVPGYRQKCGGEQGLLAASLSSREGVAEVEGVAAGAGSLVSSTKVSRRRCLFQWSHNDEEKSANEVL